MASVLALILHTDDGTLTLTQLQLPLWLLAMACWYQDTTLISKLFETYAVLRDPAIMVTHGVSALFVAACKGNERSRCQCSPQQYQRNEATAIYANAMASALELLHIRDTTTTHRDRGLCQAAALGDLEFASRLLDDAFPPTVDAITNAVSRTRCPQMLDLLLSRCYQGYDLQVLQSDFHFACRERDASIITVFLVYAMDTNYCCDHETDSPLMRALLSNYESGYGIAKLFA